MADPGEVTVTIQQKVGTKVAGGGVATEPVNVSGAVDISAKLRDISRQRLVQMGGGVKDLKVKVLIIYAPYPTLDENTSYQVDVTGGQVWDVQGIRAYETTLQLDLQRQD